MSLSVLCAVAAFLALAARVAMARAAASSHVDHYYWMLAAEAYRLQRGLPVRIAGKYLMEDETQAYPPLFGWLLGRFRLDRWGAQATLAGELLEMSILGWLMIFLGASWQLATFAMCVYFMAPVLVVYNTQMTPRTFGDFFLFLLLLTEMLACTTIADPVVQAAMWLTAALLSALIAMTHKMTLQLYGVLLVPWSLALGSAMPILAAAMGSGIFVAMVGRAFARYQFRAHREIVTFWNRHWRDLGAHQFLHSPIYGNPVQDRAGCFHASGMGGILRHLRLVVSYAPFNTVPPAISLVTGIWPPAWLLVWFLGVYAWALATLYVPRLKCLGGGHLYVFNAIAPGAIYLAWLPASTWVLAAYAGGVVLTAVALAAALHRVRSRPVGRSDDFDKALVALAELPPGNVAVFPLQSAEVVAAKTCHAVLWGGHGYGFARLEGFFPVLCKPLKEFFCAYHVDWVLWDEKYWPDGLSRLMAEGALVHAGWTFGRWRLAPCRADVARDCAT